jgi:hypothetical protein
MAKQRRPGSTIAYREARLMQELLLRDACNPETKASVRAGIARAWDILEDRKRILRAQPLPGQLRPVAEPPRRTRAATAAVPVRRPVVTAAATTEETAIGLSESAGGGE